MDRCMRLTDLLRPKKTRRGPCRSRHRSPAALRRECDTIALVHCADAALLPLLLQHPLCSARTSPGSLRSVVVAVVVVVVWEGGRP